MNINNLGWVTAGQEIKGKATQSSNSLAVGEAGFVGKMNEIAAKAGVVSKGDSASAGGLHNKKMVKETGFSYQTEEEETVDSVFGKITKIEEMLKEKFGGQCK
ncbi:MAG: hypothetical protein ABIH50_06685 [bacterium]